ncbi:uncharacterized protein LOC124154748 [Ischnura elegans]|uniref:uncharacterized protein LOC124154748 n=1 Tax=Ischnura elegans TaxID=197161 RepID=UPI001ED86780|nr:uncharacterized protein LOC124154748 [Ischnura elegans]
MGGAERFLIVLLAIPALRAHSHGIKLIVILALAYLLQQGYQKGNKKPKKSLWRRSSDEVPTDEHGETLSRALLVDLDECARRVSCIVGRRLGQGRELNEGEEALLNAIYWNGQGAPKTRGEEAFQGAVEYGRQAHAQEDSCLRKYAKCPYGVKEMDYILMSTATRLRLT